MKKPYQHPVTQELLITKAVPILAASPFQEMDTESGGDIDPNTEVETGLGSEFIFDDLDF
jgi:hypothetical protein